VSRPDFERARQYALGRLERELAPTLAYHSLAHTRKEVVPAAERLAAMEGVAGEPLLLLRTAAFFHDIGFVNGRDDHEAASAQIAGRVLPGFGYSPAQVQAIQAMILATQMGRAPATHMEQILADADLDVLGREDYVQRSQDLRDELAALGHSVPDEEWYEGQLGLLRTHRYFTASARALRDAGKRRNIEMVAALLSCSAPLRCGSHLEPPDPPPQRSHP
jgi:uncharacterized protein